MIERYSSMILIGFELNLTAHCARLFCDHLKALALKQILFVYTVIKMTLICKTRITLSILNVYLET